MDKNMFRETRTGVTDIRMTQLINYANVEARPKM